MEFYCKCARCYLTPNPIPVNYNSYFGYPSFHSCLHFVNDVCVNLGSTFITKNKRFVYQYCEGKPIYFKVIRISAQPFDDKPSKLRKYQNILNDIAKENKRHRKAINDLEKAKMMFLEKECNNNGGA